MIPLLSALCLLTAATTFGERPPATPHEYAYEYYDRAAKARRPLNCEVIGGLLRETLSEGKADPVAFVWQVCEADPHPGILAWQAGNFPLDGLTVARAAFYYEKPYVNWSYLDLRRWVVIDAAAARAEFMIENTALAARLDEQHPRLRDVQVETTAEQIGFRATMTYGPLRVPFTAAGHLSLQPRPHGTSDLHFTVDAAKMSFVPVPWSLLPRIERTLNPITQFRLRQWKLKPADLRVLPPPENAIVISAVYDDATTPKPKAAE